MSAANESDVTNDELARQLEVGKEDAKRTDEETRVDQQPAPRQSCSFCGKKGFRTSFALQSHLRFHHGREPGFIDILSSLLPGNEAAVAKRLGCVLRVAWEDDWLAVVVKPQGVKTQGKGGSLQHADWLLAQLQPSVAFDALRMPRPVHRLDAGTGGLVVLAKCDAAVRRLTTMFEEKQIKKRYRALVHGRLEAGEEGQCDEPVDGKAAHTVYKVVLGPVELPDGWVSTVDLWPSTGKRHQLRKHLSSLGYPIVGDKRYGGWRPKDSVLGTERPCGNDTDDDSGADSDDEHGAVHRIFCLWALEIEFPHPARPLSGSAQPDEQASSSEVDVVVSSSGLDDFRLYFLEPAHKKKKRARVSNVIGDVTSGTTDVRAGDLLIRVNGAIASADTLDNVSRESKDLRLTFRRPAARVLAQIEEPILYQQLRCGTRPVP